MLELICSDTNVWIDFNVIDAVEFPFRLSCTYVMWKDAVDDEVKSPKGLRNRLLQNGLVPVEITEEEFWLADDLGDRYLGLSPYDSAALAIAKTRNIFLMTGDKRLRKAAVKEGVKLTGTIGVLDRLRDEGLVAREEYHNCIKALFDVNGSIVRLPEDELRKRLKRG